MKTTLRWYSTVVLGLVGATAYWFVLRPEDRTWVQSKLGQFPQNSIIATGAVALLAAFVGWILVFGFQIHDKVYDKYVTRWRLYYDVDFILHNLVRPFASHVDQRFFLLAEQNKYDYMNRLYYHFVGDMEHEHKIQENLVLRFYEAITNYWITQLNEIFLFSFLLITLVYGFTYPADNLSLLPVLATALVLLSLLVLNRLAVLRSRVTVRIMTRDEIADIHERYQTVLEDRLKQLHLHYNLRYE